MKNQKDWFVDWFDTSYYHLLYDHRNEAEAEFFMKNMINYLKIKKGDCILDLPCGKGRHSLFLNTQGFKVVGADLSVNSIELAKKFENNMLRFEVHDMRDQLNNKYDAIFNLFTSFGYFNLEETNIKVLRNFKKALNKNGHIVIDFLNIEKIEKELTREQVIVKKNISFHIKKMIHNNFLIKDISFEDNGKKFHFSEKLQYITSDKLKYFAKQSGLHVKHIFGNYHLDNFNINTSDRLIMVLE